MDLRNTRNPSRITRGRGRSRNVDNLHVINTSLSSPIANTSELSKAVTTFPKIVSESKELKGVKTFVHKTCGKSRPFALQKCSTTYMKKKINAAKNFLQVKEFPLSPVKKHVLSNNLEENLPVDKKSSNTAHISDKSVGCLDFKKTDKAVSNPKLNLAKNTSVSERNDAFVRHENTNSSWVPVETKKRTSISKELPVEAKKETVVTKESTSSPRVLEKNRKCDSPRNSLTDKKKSPPVRKERSRRMSMDFSHERMHRYSNSSRHFLSRQEEERYYRDKYSRKSKTRSRDYEREHSRYYRESYSYQSQRKIHEQKKPIHEEMEVLEEISDIPLEEDFEEVETASVEDINRPTEIPVGFRKYKLKYLNFKQFSFFKPKVYCIDQERTIVSCLNVRENESVEVDVVSEVECDDHEIVEVNSRKSENKNTVQDHKSVEKEKTSIKPPCDKENNEFKSITAKVNNENVIGNEAVMDTFCENNVAISIREEFEETGKQNNLEANVAGDSVGLIPTGETLNEDVSESSVAKPKIMEPQKVILNSKIYYTCIPESESSDFYQGSSLVQNYLNEWESHLIGLEYVIEIRDTSNNSQVKKYYCGLCEEDIHNGNNTGRLITDHVTSYNHGSLSMAKHFPSCGYKFSKNVDSFISGFVLQKCCEEINQKLGYFLMCITTDGYFQKKKKEIDKLLNNIVHWSETNMKVDATVYLNNFNSIISKEILQLTNDMVNKISPGEEISTFITSRNESAQDLRKKKARNSKKAVDHHALSCNDTGTTDNLVNTGRNLIVLTPQYQPLLKCPTVPLTPVRSNLLHVVTHEISTQGLNQTIPALDVSSQETTSVFENEELSDKNREMASPALGNVPNVNSFRPVSKKANSFRKYRTTSKTSSKVNINIKKEMQSVRTVRKIGESSGDITISLESKNFENSEINVSDDEPEVKNEPVEINENYKITESIQQFPAENFESEFSDTADVFNIIPPQDYSVEKETSKNKCKAKHRTHQKTTQHSKYCLKRILGKSSKFAKESSVKKESNDSEEDVITLNETFESDLLREIKDLSPVDSAASSGSRKITSPLKTCYSPDPYRRHSRLSGRRHSRSPYRRRSRSPRRRRDGSYRRHSRSPFGRLNRRYSRSPARRYSRSPVRRRSRTPRRRSRSPLRRRSRSPMRRYSRSPVRRHSRSPFRRHSRSPFRRRSRSPSWRGGRLANRKRSRSPYRRISRSPTHGRSSFKNILASPPRRLTVAGSPLLYEKNSRSPLRKESERFDPDKGFRSNSRSSFYKDSVHSSEPHGEFESLKHTHHPDPLMPVLEKEVVDLDPISDEDESTYFNTMERPQHMEEIKKLPEPTRSMVIQLLREFSVSKVNPSDPVFNEIMQLVNEHNSKFQLFMAQHNSFNDISNQVGNSNMPLRGANLQQYLMSNTRGNECTSRSPAFTTASPSFQPPHPLGASFSSARPDSFIQPPFQPRNKEQHAPLQPTVASSLAPHPKTFGSASHPEPSLLPQHYDTFPPCSDPPNFPPNLGSEVMFNDLKATVSKLFGADCRENEDTQLPLHEFMPEHGSEKWPLNRQLPPNPVRHFQCFGSKKVIEDKEDSDFRNLSKGPMDSQDKSLMRPGRGNSGPYFSDNNTQKLHIPPPDAKVSFCDGPHAPMHKNLFPVVTSSAIFEHDPEDSQKSVVDAKFSLAQRLAAVLVKVGMVDVPGPLLQEMLMKIGAFSPNPPQDISEMEISEILKKLGYVT
ncbi:uncharacterized protein NPIL_20581 [Nephila pilipes]|uniref:Uncharacterized protein n=1 Tax=Nephila pilipes TaxID=299642 RepID=A0A8X6UB13_NEPPI|nr:uncharacterized protein NPIL_20581 [Nephila pilipes]